MNATRLLALAVLLSSAAIAGGTEHGTLRYPSKPIRLLVPAPPGGSTNLIARIVGAKLAKWDKVVKAAGIKLD